MNTAPVVAPDVAVEKPDYSKLGRRWDSPDRRTTVIQLVDGEGKDTGRRLVVSDPRVRDQKAHSVAEMDKGEETDQNLALILGPNAGEGRPAIRPVDIPSALAATRDRLDAARRGWVADDGADAGGWLRTAAAHTTDEKVRRHLLDADRALVAGDLAGAAIAVERTTGDGGRDQDRMSTVALETVHGSRSREEWSQRLAARDYGLVPVAEGNRTSWQVEDRRTGKQVALADLGFEKVAAPAEIEKQWAAGMAANIEPVLIERDILSTKRPAPQVLGDSVSDRTRRADDLRHGQDRALEAALAALPTDKLAAVVNAKKSLLADRIKEGDTNTKVTAVQLDERLAKDGVSFGSEIDRDGNARTIGFAEALTKAEPAPATKEHMKRWLSGTIWSAQNQLLADNKPPTWETYQEALADRGVEVQRSWNGDKKVHEYSYATTLPGVGRFEHGERDLGFDAEKDPRLGTHALIESAEVAVFRAKATNALADAADRADKANPLAKMAKTEHERVDAALAESGLRLRVMEQEYVGSKKDGQAVFAVRLGVEDIKSGRIAPLSDCGRRGTDYATLGSKVHMLGGPAHIEKFNAQDAFDMFKTGFKESLSGIGEAMSGALSGRTVDIWNSGRVDIWRTVKPAATEETAAKPLRKPSWERGTGGDTQSSPPRDRLPSM